MYKTKENANGSITIIQDNKPTMVIMPYELYNTLLNNNLQRDALLSDKEFLDAMLDQLQEDFDQLLNDYQKLQKRVAKTD